MHDYYTATLLDQLRFWFWHPDSKTWCKFKHEAITLGNLQSLLAIANAFYPNLKIGSDHPTISAFVSA